MESTNRRRRRQKGYPCNALRLLIRLWGIITSIGKNKIDTFNVSHCCVSLNLSMKSALFRKCLHLSDIFIFALILFVCTVSFCLSCVFCNLVMCCSYSYSYSCFCSIVYILFYCPYSFSSVFFFFVLWQCCCGCCLLHYWCFLLILPSFCFRLIMFTHYFRSFWLHIFCQYCFIHLVMATFVKHILYISSVIICIAIRDLDQTF